MMLPSNELVFTKGRRRDRTGRTAIMHGEEVRQPPLWKELTEQEKTICMLFVVHGKGFKEIAWEHRISRSRVGQVLRCACRILRVEGGRRLAFWMGQHWQEILNGDEHSNGATIQWKTTGRNP